MKKFIYSALFSASIGLTASAFFQETAASTPVYSEPVQQEYAMTADQLLIAEQTKELEAFIAKLDRLNNK